MSGLARGWALGRGIEARGPAAVRLCVGLVHVCSRMVRRLCGWREGGLTGRALGDCLGPDHSPSGGEE